MSFVRLGRQTARQADQHQRNTATVASGPACTKGQRTLPADAPYPGVTHFPISVIGGFCCEDERRSGRQTARQAGQGNTATVASGPACTTGQRTLPAEAPNPGVTHFPTSVIGRFCREDEPRSFGPTDGSASRSGSGKYRHRGEPSRLHHRAADPPCRGPKPRRDTLPRIGYRQVLQLR
jgi:hypothetical protein